MGVPIAIFLVCAAAAVYAGTRWLPQLAPGPVGRLAFFAVCGLLGAAAAAFGLGVYGIVEDLGEGGRFLARARVLAAGLETLLWQTGLLVALALAVYLLAPPREDEEASLVSGADPGSDPA